MLLNRLFPFLLSLVILSGCTTLVGTREVNIPITKLQQAIENKFPVNNTLLAMFDITLSQPVVSLLPDKNRMQLSMDTVIAPALLGRSWTGSFTVSGNLALDANGEAVVLKAPKVEALTLDGESPVLSGRLQKVSNFFVEQWLDNAPLYRFESEKLTVAGVRMKPTAISTRAHGIVVTFDPVR